MLSVSLSAAKRGGSATSRNAHAKELTVLAPDKTPRTSWNSTSLLFITNKARPQKPVSRGELAILTGQAYFAASRGQ